MIKLIPYIFICWLLVMPLVGFSQCKNCKELTEARANLNRLQQHSRSLAQIIVVLRIKVDSLEKVIVIKDKIIDAQKQEIERLRKEVERLKGIIAQKNKKIKQLTTDLNIANKTIQQRNDSITELWVDIHYLEDTLQKAENHISCLKTQRETLFTERLVHAQTLLSRGQQLARNKAHIKRLETEVAILNQKRLDDSKLIGGLQTELRRKSMAVNFGLQLNMAPLFAQPDSLNYLQFLSHPEQRGFRRGDLGFWATFGGIGYGRSFAYTLPNAQVAAPEQCPTIHRLNAIQQARILANEPIIPLRHHAYESMNMRNRNWYFMVNPAQVVNTIRILRGKSNNDKYGQNFSFILGRSRVTGRYWQTFRGDLGDDAVPLYSNTSPEEHFYAANCQPQVNQGGFIIGGASSGPLVAFGKEKKYAVGYQFTGTYNSLWNAFTLGIGFSGGATSNIFTPQEKATPWPPPELVRTLVEEELMQYVFDQIESKTEELEKRNPKGELKPADFEARKKLISQEMDRLNESLDNILLDEYNSLIAQPKYAHAVKFCKKPRNQNRTLSAVQTEVDELCTEAARYLTDMLRQNICN